MNHAFRPPALPIPDCTTFAALGPLLMKTMDLWEAGVIEPSPFFFFEVCDTPPWKHIPLRTSPTPERLLCVVMDNPGRQVMFSALAEVAKREGSRPRLRQMRVFLEANSRLKLTFQQMAETPLTVYSVTPPNLIGPSYFFIRGIPTTTALREEFPKHTLDPDARFEPSNFRLVFPTTAQN